MENCQPPDEPDRYKAVYNKDNWQDIIWDDTPYTPSLSNNGNPRKCENVYTQNGRCWYKHYEKSIISQPNTLTYPRAVVIKLLNTIVADRAMRSPWWTVQKASVTKLHFHRVSVDRYILYSGYFQIRRLMIDPLHRRGGHVYLIWVRWYRVSWNDPGISTRSQEEKKKILHKQLTDQV